jgi:glucokinase
MDPVGVIIRLFTRLCVHIGGMLGVGLAEVIRKLIQILNRGRRQSSKEKQIARTQQAETSRMAGCRKVVMEFVNALGYIAREAMNREELALQRRL